MATDDLDALRRLNLDALTYRSASDEVPADAPPAKVAVASGDGA